jgi:hypothetical protein
MLCLLLLFWAGRAVTGGAGGAGVGGAGGEAVNQGGMGNVATGGGGGAGVGGAGGAATGGALEEAKKKAQQAMGQQCAPLSHASACARLRAHVRHVVMRFCRLPLIYRCAGSPAEVAAPASAARAARA